MLVHKRYVVQEYAGRGQRFDHVVEIIDGVLHGAENLPRTLVHLMVQADGQAWLKHGGELRRYEWQRLQGEGGRNV